MKQRGFTLIELMICLVFLVIIGSIAYSAYKNLRNRPPEPVHRSYVQRDLSDCDFLGLDADDRSVYRCADGKIYTDF